VLNLSSVTFSPRKDFLVKSACFVIKSHVLHRSSAPEFAMEQLSIDVMILLNSISSGEGIRPEVEQNYKCEYFSALRIRAASSRVSNVTVECHKVG
jgi:hypothetical protein